MVEHTDDWDLASIPDHLFWAEVGRRRGRTGGTRPALQPCPQCQRPTTARERRKACTCGYRWDWRTVYPSKISKPDTAPAAIIPAPPDPTAPAP